MKFNSHRLRFALATLVLCCLAQRSESGESRAKVRYRSAETVYLDAGTTGGLAIGDRLDVIRDSKVVAQIEVVFTAEYSSACRILEERDRVVSGDHARLSAPAPEAPSTGRAPKLPPAPDWMMRRASPSPRDTGLETRPSDIDAMILQRIEDSRSRNVVSTVTGDGDATDSVRDPIEGLQVRYRSATTLYIDGGEAAGLAIGDRLEVAHRGIFVAVARVTTIRAFAAACQILAEDESVQIGDSIQPVGAVQGAASDAAESELETGTPKTIVATRPAELALEPSSVLPVRWQPPRRPRHRRTRVSGALILDWERFTEESETEPLEFQRTEARLSLRVLDIGGSPYALRVRMRTQQNQRAGLSMDDIPTTESRNRFYELSLTYDPPRGRFAYRVGRMSASPFVGIGYIDGLLGQMALSSSFELGGFIGSTGNIEEIGFETTRQKYGLFTRFTSARTDSRLPWEVILAGIREDGEEDVSREYVTLQTRFAGKGRFSFYQRAELDINRGWRKEVTGKTSQLSNFSMVATARLSRFSHMSLSYDRFEPYRTEETRLLPEERFNAFLRQGWRASLYFGRPRGINVALNAGFRDQEGEAENTVSYGLSVRYSDVASIGLSLGGDYLGFSNPFTSGYVATFRASQRLPGGHQVDLALGNRISTNVLFEDNENESQWIRLGTWFELPKNLFGNSEYEIGQGDDLQGQRLSLSLGYRF